MYSVIRNPHFEGVREVMIPSHAATETICRPDKSSGSRYKQDLSQMVSELVLAEPETIRVLEKANPENTTFIRIHTGSGDYGLDTTLPFLFPNIQNAAELIVDSKREKRAEGWITHPGRPRGGLAIGSPLTLITADIVATGASEKRAFIEAFVSTLHPSTYSAINKELGFPLQNEPHTKARLEALRESGVVDNIDKLILIEGLYDLHADAITKAARTIKSIAGERVQSVEHFIFLAHGAELAGPIAAECSPLYRIFSPDFTFHILYPAGAFELATKNTPLAVKNDGTDILVRNGASLELMTYMLEHPQTWELTCIVYYGSARGGRPFIKHPLDMLRSQFALYEAAERGLTKKMHLTQRMPALIGTPGKSYVQFKEEALQIFSAVPLYKAYLEKTIHDCYTAYVQFWKNNYAREPLKASLQRRITDLCTMFEGNGAVTMAHELARLHAVNITLPEDKTEPNMQQRIIELMAGKKQNIYIEHTH